MGWFIVFLGAYLYWAFKGIAYTIIAMVILTVWFMALPFRAIGYLNRRYNV